MTNDGVVECRRGTNFVRIEGSYSVPSYLSPEAVTLLRKMLVVNPVNRITVAEIRQDPWFKHNLPEYLRPQEEGFVDTGVDPRRHPPRNRDTSRANAAGELHEAVVGKLKKTLGYGNEDVHEALGKEEPNAIKDAYNIVRENQMMIWGCKCITEGPPPHWWLLFAVLIF